MPAFRSTESSDLSAFVGTDQLSEGFEPREPFVGTVRKITTEAVVWTNDDGSETKETRLVFTVEPRTIAVESVDGLLRLRWRISSRKPSRYSIAMGTIEGTLGFPLTHDTLPTLIGEDLVWGQLPPTDARLDPLGKFRGKNNLDVCLGRPEPGWERQIPHDIVDQKRAALQKALERQAAREAGQSANGPTGPVTTFGPGAPEAEVLDLFPHLEVLLAFYDGQAVATITRAAVANQRIQALPGRIRAAVMADKAGKQLIAQGSLRRVDGVYYRADN